jgi:hypothetical protein
MSEDDTILSATTGANEITESEVRNQMMWEALAKMARANATQLKTEIGRKLASNPDGLKSKTLGDIEIRSKHTKVDFNTDIIQTISDIDGVSEDDKRKLFHPPVKRANAVHLNSLDKKYGGSVSERISKARMETGHTIEFKTNRVVQDEIRRQAEQLIKTNQMEGEFWNE